MVGICIFFFFTNFYIKAKCKERPLVSHIKVVSVHTEVLCIYLKSKRVESNDHHCIFPYIFGLISLFLFVQFVSDKRISFKGIMINIYRSLAFFCIFLIDLSLQEYLGKIIILWLYIRNIRLNVENEPRMQWWRKLSQWKIYINHYVLLSAERTSCMNAHA